ncbi:MAG: hypothetical protein P4L46_17625 [Fimbriimonas sp.]|nr:hypothetical protein [Fimbriimonas sp.]
MADIRDVRGQRVARTELSKRGVDITRCDIRMHHGILYIKGAVSTGKGATFKDLRTEMEHIGRILKSKSDIRDVVIDCQILGGGG